VACAALLSAATGCPPPTVYQTGDTLEPGQWQVGGGLGTGSMRDDEQQVRIPTGDVELFARRGIGANLDVGLRLYSPGLEASLKWRFKRDRWSMAVMPGLAVLATNENVLTTEAFHSFLTVPMLASRRLSPRWSVSLGPKAMTGLYWSTTSKPALGLGAGGYTMVALHLGNWRVMPEIDIARTIAGDVPIDGWAAHFGIGLAWQKPGR
jgi:hypothetical protein